MIRYNIPKKICNFWVFIKNKINGVEKNNSKKLFEKIFFFFRVKIKTVRAVKFSKFPTFDIFKIAELKRIVSELWKRLNSENL